MNLPPLSSTPNLLKALSIVIIISVMILLRVYYPSFKYDPQIDAVGEKIIKVETGLDVTLTSS